MSGYGWNRPDGNQPSQWFLPDHTGKSKVYNGNHVQRRRDDYRVGQSLFGFDTPYGWSPEQNRFPYYNRGGPFSGYPGPAAWENMRPPGMGHYQTIPLGVLGYEDDFSWFDGWSPGNGMYDAYDNDGGRGW